MNKSLTYYLTIFVIQLKGIKNIFSKSPIDYLKLRKIDVYSPTSKFYKTNKISTFQILKTAITQIENTEKTNKLLIYLHGGAFISGPAQHHWDSLEYISKKTNLDIWMCNYPKAPENKIEEISINMDQIYETALSKYPSENIILMGDSAGGTLVIALTQRLILNKEKLPSKLILISPVLDATFKNEKILEIEKKDIMLSKKGVSSAISMCSEHSNDPRISPINGEFNFFPKTYLYIAEHDITFPDQLIFSSKLNLENIDNEIYIGKEMPHIWPLLPVMKEAKTALHQIINNINA
jgi:acetyl esterase/lipase